MLLLLLLVLPLLYSAAAAGGRVRRGGGGGGGGRVAPGRRVLVLKDIKARDWLCKTGLLQIVRVRAVKGDWTR